MTTPMPGSRSLVKQPIGPGSDSHGFGWKTVLVRSLDLKRRVALCTDDFGRSMEIRCDILRSKGNLPEPGEQWVIDRQYGIWTFALIVNGTTRGVEVDNVTDLPETLDNIGTTITNNVNTLNAADASQVAATNALTAATTGRISAKGDILAGTSAGVVTRQPAGSDGAVPVYDSTSGTGLTPRVPLALTIGLSGATSAGRYVGNTVSGAPTSGTFLKGDWVTDQNGYDWQCTAAGSPGTWVTRNIDTSRVSTLESGASTSSSNISALQNNVSTNDLRGSGKHIWSASNRPLNGGGSDIILTTWSQYFSDGIATLNGSGLFQFNSPGKWSIAFYVQSDSTVAGSMLFYIQAGSPSSWGPANNTFLRCRNARATGFGNAGRLDQSIVWSGRVASSDASQAFAIHCSWQASDGSTNTTLNYSMEMEYLGPA